MRSVGIDIGTFSIKVVELFATQKEFSIVSAEEFLLNPDPAADKTVQILEALRSISLKYDPANTKFVLSAPQQMITFRHKTFPFRERQKILKSLAFELEDEIPLNQDNALFEAKVIGYRKNTSAVLALATPKSVVQAILTRCQDASIDPDIISMEAAAISSLYEDWASPLPELEPLREAEESPIPGADLIYDPEPARVLIHIGHERTLLTIIHKKSLLTSRNIYCGGSQIVASIQKKYNMPFVEALKGFVEKGFVLTSQDKASPDQMAFSSTITDVLKDLISEGKRTLLETQSIFKIKYDRIDITGGVAKLINLGPYLTQAFELPANPLSPLQSFSKPSLGLDENKELRMGIAMGLAIEGLKRQKNPPVNLRKNEFNKENRGLTQIWDKWHHAIKVGAALTVLFFVYASLRESFSTGLADAAYQALRKKASSMGLQKNQLSPGAIQKYIRAEEQKIEAQKALSKLQNLNSSLDLMLKVSQIAPSKDRIKLDVRRFYILNEYLTVEGEVAQRDSLADLKRSLSTLASDGQVKELSPSFRPQGQQVAFAYALKVRRKPQGSQ